MSLRCNTSKPLLFALKAGNAAGLALALLGISPLSPLRSSADEFDVLRLKWQEMLTLGTNAALTDPNYSGWILSVGNGAQNYWNSMIGGPSRTCLWNDLNGLNTNSSQITASYARLRAMALGYAVRGTSVESNALLRSAIVGGLDWLYSNYYNENGTEYDNWFDWEIGTPLQLNDIAVLVYGGLSGSQLTNYMNAIEHFTPTPNLSGANEVWKASVVAVRGILVKDSAKLAASRQALSDIFLFVNTGDGFYADGSFIFHSIFSYNTGYGSDLLETLAPLLQLLKGSSWEVTDPLQTNVFRWIYDAFEPLIYRGASMQMASGRYYSRTGDDHREGHRLLASILRITQFAPPEDAAAYKSQLKYWFQADSSRSFAETAPPPENVWAKAILNDTNVVPSAEPTGHFQFPHMDRVVHLRPGWAVGLAMSSSRIGNYECTRNENFRGWYTGEGMLYLYNNDLEHFADQYWSTVNPYRLPGTTVDTQARTNGQGEGYLSPNAWTGGASIGKRYGVAGMQLNAWNSTLVARKSWFLLDDKVVCLGSGITSSDGRPIETIVENHKLSVYGNNPLFVNGVQEPNSVGWAETLTNVSWVHLGGNVPGADIGYWFPQPVTAKALREPRSGSFYDLNATYGSRERVTRNYFTLWLDHGINPSNATYTYVLLPNWTVDQTAAFSANPGLTILENSTKAQGVRDSTMGITGVNFWRDGTNKVGGITVDRKAAVIMRDDGFILDLGVSDPTQTNDGIINLEINLPASALLSADNEIELMQLSPTLKLAINVNGAGGQTRSARFFMGTVQTNAFLPVADAYVTSGDQANTNFGTAVTLAVKASGTLLRETYLRFELPPPPGVLLSATLRLMPVRVNDAAIYHALSPVADDSWAETGITWNSMPASGPAFTNWMLPPAGNPVQVSITELAQGAANSDGKLSLRIYSTGTPPGGDGYVSYASRENGTSASRPRIILNCAPIPPRVDIIQPVQDAIFSAPASPELLASAQSSGAMITNVEFYAGSVRLGQAGALPYRCVLANLPAGNYSFTAVATDASGLVGTSAPTAIQVLAPEPLGRGTGLIGDYYTNQNLTGLRLTRLDSTIDFNWDYASPAPGIPSDHFSVRWSGQIQARRAGLHLFHTISDDGVRLWINGQLLIDNWPAHFASEDTASIQLLPGQYYPIVLEYYDNSRTALAQLLWTEPGGSKQVIPTSQLYPADLGLQGDYFSGLVFDSLSFSRIDPEVNFNWIQGSPDQVLLPGAFSVRWKGKVRADVGGSYDFSVLSQGSARLWINGQLLINNWAPHALVENSGSIPLECGRFYDLVLEFSSSYSSPRVMLRWTPPGQSREMIPRSNFTAHQANQPPQLVPTPTLYAARGQPLVLQIRAFDPDPGQSITFSLDPGAIPDATINAGTGRFEWTPSPLLPLGEYKVIFRVTDDGVPSMTDAQSIIINLNTNIATARVWAIREGSLWRFLGNGVEPATNWTGNGFSDADWLCGAAPLGYGHGDESTVIGFGPNPTNKPITTYFRQTFFVPNASMVQSLSGRLRSDDGIVLYLNGVEAFRRNLPLGLISADSVALRAVDGPQGTNWVAITLDPQSLVDGTNTIAAELHLASPAGPDAGFDLELEFLVAIPTQPFCLVAKRVGGAIELHWPATAAWLRLYTATEVDPIPGWAPIIIPVLFTNGECQVIVPVMESRRFYKLGLP